MASNGGIRAPRYRNRLLLTLPVSHTFENKPEHSYQKAHKGPRLLYYQVEKLLQEFQKRIDYRGRGSFVWHVFSFFNMSD